MRLQKTFLGITFGILFSGTASATGILTADVAALTQHILSAAQQLSELKNQLEQQVTAYNKQVEQWTQQMKDAAAPLQTLYESVHTLYSSGNALIGEVNGLYAQASNLQGYIDTQFGSADWWEQCALSGCDPTSQLKLAYNEAYNSIDSAIKYAGNATAAVEKNAQVLVKISQDTDRGTNQTLGKIQEAEIANGLTLAQMAKDQSAYHVAMMNQEKEKKAADQAALIRVSNMLDNQKTTIVNGEW